MNNKQLAEALRAIDMSALPIKDRAAVLNAAEALEIGEAHSVTDERAAFEAWYDDDYAWHAWNGTGYDDFDHNKAWLAWQARAALSAAASKGDAQ